MCRALVEAATTRWRSVPNSCTKQTRRPRASHEQGAAAQHELPSRPCEPGSRAGTRLALGQWMTGAPHVVTPPLWEEEIPGGSHWSGVLRRGVVLRLVAQDD